MGEGRNDRPHGFKFKEDGDILCSECKMEVKKSTKLCPHCGANIKKHIVTKLIKWLIWKPIYWTVLGMWRLSERIAQRLFG